MQQSMFSVLAILSQIVGIPWSMQASSCVTAWQGDVRSFCAVTVGVQQMLSMQQQSLSVG